MWEPADVEKAIAEHPHEAADAMAALPLESGARRINIAALRLASETTPLSLEELWVASLDNLGLLEDFVLALAARGVPIDLGSIPVDETTVTDKEFDRFLNAARAFRCRITKDGRVVGSGVLVGPTTVLTAWHVIARASPDQPQEPWPEIEVVLANKKSMKAHVPAAYFSKCSVDEFKSRFPRSDRDVADLHDVAVLRLARPAGALLGTAKLPESPVEYKANRPMFLVHYPDGQDRGIGVGAITRIRNLNARWSHTIGTKGGSSGGGCFDVSRTLIGIHQGLDSRRRGRLVPISRFYDKLREIVANDEAPRRMWSLDETPDGEFIVGRQGFFEAFAMVRRNRRVRGIRIKRANAAGDLSGIPFSFHMLEQMTARIPELRLVRVSFETLLTDVADEIARRVSDTGIAVDPVSPAAGVADGQSAPEAVGADRGRRVAALIDRKCAELGVQAWIFIEHPAIVFGDSLRSALEAFVDASLQLDNIRLVIAGYEAVAMAGQDFYAEPNPPDEGGRGLMTELIAGFRASDVRLFLSDAAAAAGKTVSKERLDELVEEALDGLPNTNGVYEPWVAADVADRLRKPVLEFFGRDQ
jgi:hypothetical protein